MARKNPLGKLVDTAVDALKHPVGTAGKAVDTARGTASLGKLAAEQVTKAAASTALGAVGAVAERAGVRKPSAPTSEPAPEPTSPADLRPVPSVNEPAHPPVEEERPAPARVASTTASKAPAKRADGSAPKKAAAKKAPGTNAPATKAPAKKAAAKKAPAKKTAKSTTARVAPASPEPKAVPDRRAAEPASGRQEQALSPNPEEVAKKAAAKGAAANESPAKRVAASKTVKQAPAKKSAAKKSPATKATAKKAPTKKSAAKVAESRDVAPVAEDETVWSTSTPGDKLPAGRGKRNEADPEVPVTKEDLEAAHRATPADVAERVEGD